MAMFTRNFYIFLLGIVAATACQQKSQFVSIDKHFPQKTELPPSAPIPAEGDKNKRGADEATGSIVKGLSPKAAPEDPIGGIHQTSGMTDMSAVVSGNGSSVVDTTAPVISDLRVAVPNDSLSTLAPVSVALKISNPSGVEKIIVEIKDADGKWVKVAEGKPADESITFPRGANTQTNNLEIRVTTVNKPGVQKTLPVETIWKPSVFRSAILTRTVQCLFCHMRIEGDVGGIDFPTTGVRDDTGSGLTITGKLFATNQIPNKLWGHSLKGEEENYHNSNKIIFPKDFKFPDLKLVDIAGAVKGKLVGDLRHYKLENTPHSFESFENVFKGNVVLDGTKTPFQISGEVFIDGDLVIKGKYSGKGTIYAKNIYIIDDVIAVKSSFPYPVAEENAIKHALTPASRDADALHLGAIGDVIVGDPNHGFEKTEVINNITTSRPYSWISRENLLALGSPPPSTFKLETAGGNLWAPTRKPRSIIETSRIDAFIFAGNAFIWQAYGSLLLNGGYMAPHSVIISSLVVETGSIWNCPATIPFDPVNTIPTACGTKMPLLNPRNGMPLHTNVIRYDYRLATGSPGFELIRKEFLVEGN